MRRILHVLPWLHLLLIWHRHWRRRLRIPAPVAKVSVLTSLGMLAMLSVLLTMLAIGT